MMKMIITLIIPILSISLFIFTNCSELSGNKVSNSQPGVSQKIFKRSFCGKTKSTLLGGSAMAIKSGHDVYSIISNKVTLKALANTYIKHSTNTDELYTPVPAAQGYLFWEFACVYSNREPTQSIEGKDLHIEAIKFLRAPPSANSIKISKLSNYSFCGNISYTGLGGCNILLETNEENYCIDSKLFRIREILNAFENGDSFKGCVYSENPPTNTFEGNSLEIDGFSF